MSKYHFMVPRISSILIAFLTFLVSVNFVSAQDTLPKAKKEKKSRWVQIANDTAKDDYYQNNFFRCENYVYKSNIRTVQLHEQSYELSNPVIKLNAGQKLELSFDDLEGGYKSYGYTLIHCDASWQPSDIMPMEYLEGFMDDKINNYRYSLNTIQKYTHYSAIFPNDNMTITKAGNYILKVYLDKPENAVISRRFMVYDSKVNIAAIVQPATIIEDRNYKQQVVFTIEHAGYDIRNPYSDLKVVIAQNGRWDNILQGLKPTFVKDNELVYDLDRDNVFSAGSEYRYFDIKSIKYQSARVKRMTSDSSNVEVFLTEDEKKVFKRYSSGVDINGKYLIKINEGKNSEIEADYVKVHFFLSYNELIPDGNLYVFGSLSDWTCKNECKLVYNQQLSGYEGTLLLKQGYYNYEYGFLKDGETAVDNTLIEGMHYETENDYDIYVYYRAPGTFYEQLIGFKHVNSIRNY